MPASSSTRGSASSGPTRASPTALIVSELVGGDCIHFAYRLAKSCRNCKEIVGSIIYA